MPLGAHPPPNQREATPYHNCNPAAADQHHAPSTTGEQSGGRKTSSFQ